MAAESAQIQPDHSLWLGVLRPKAEVDGGFRLTVPLTSEEYREIRYAADRVAYLSRSKAIQLVCRNHEEFLELALAVGTEAKQHGTHHPDPGHWKARYFDLQCSLTNVLDSMRLFVESTRARFTRLYGTESGQYERFNSICAEAFDRSTAYRLVYKLRDFVTHVAGLPPMDFKITGTLNTDTEGIDTVQSFARLSFQPAELLDAWDEWRRHVTADLHSQMGGRIDVVSAIGEAVNHAVQIADAVQDIEIHEAKPSARLIATWVARLGEIGSGAPIVVDLGEGGLGGSKEWSVLQLPIAAATAVANTRTEWGDARADP